MFMKQVMGWGLTFGALTAGSGSFRLLNNGELVCDFSAVFRGSRSGAGAVRYRVGGGRHGVNKKVT